MNNKRLFYYI